MCTEDDNSTCATGTAAELVQHTVKNRKPTFHSDLPYIGVLCHRTGLIARIGLIATGRICAILQSDDAVTVYAFQQVGQCGRGQAVPIS